MFGAERKKNADQFSLHPCEQIAAPALTSFWHFSRHREILFYIPFQEVFKVKDTNQFANSSDLGSQSGCDFLSEMW